MESVIELTKEQKREKDGCYTVVQNLLPRHSKIMDLLIEGFTPFSAASKLNMPYRQVYNLVHTPSFQHKLHLRRTRVEERIEDKIVEDTLSVQDYLQEATQHAAQKLISLMDSPSDTVARAAANDILDRTGFAKVTKNENIVTSVEIDSDMSKTIAETLKMLDQQKPEKGEPEQKSSLPPSARQADSPTPQPLPARPRENLPEKGVVTPLPRDNKIEKPKDIKE